MIILSLLFLLILEFTSLLVLSMLSLPSKITGMDESTITGIRVGYMCVCAHVCFCVYMYVCI